MIKRITISLAFLMTLGSQATSGIEDGTLLKGQHIFVCDGETFTIVDTETGWGLLSEPDVEVSTTYDGFMLVDNKSGTERSLGKSVSGADVMYVYYKGGTKVYDCIYFP